MKTRGRICPFLLTRGGAEFPGYLSMGKPPTVLYRKTTYSRPNATIKRNMPTSATGSV